MSISTSLPAKSSRPWYREPWPWFLMALPGIAVIACMVTLHYAIISDDGVVADDYYKRGLAINEDIAREKMAGALGLNAQLSVDDRSASVAVKLTAKNGVRLPERLRLLILHPTRKGLDQQVVLYLKNGAYIGSFTPIEAGRWDVSLEDEAGSWRMVAETRIPASSAIVLMPNGA